MYGDVVNSRLEAQSAADQPCRTTHESVNLFTQCFRRSFSTWNIWKIISSICFAGSHVKTKMKIKNVLRAVMVMYLQVDVIVFQTLCFSYLRNVIAGKLVAAFIINRLRSTCIWFANGFRQYFTDAAHANLNGAGSKKKRSKYSIQSFAC